MTLLLKQITMNEKDTGNDTGNVLSVDQYGMDGNRRIDRWECWSNLVLRHVEKEDAYCSSPVGNLVDIVDPCEEMTI